ncbi:cation-transporting P-type ATPase [Streptomyces sp. NPDC085639]|uniref:cation-transporting P-type ATPase n=1 Tax=Streptomyces sp. NPDC085639 TaxID=3365734 RepID=UPI0037CE319A
MAMTQATAEGPVRTPDGLTDVEADRRLAEHGRNEIPPAPATPWYARVLAQLRDPLIMVLLGAVVLTIAIGDHADAVVIAVVIVVKTGTLTEGRMVVQHVWTPRAAVDSFGVAYEPQGDVLVEGRQPTAAELGPVQELLTAASLCNDASLRPPQGEPPHEDRWTAVGDPMEAALLSAAVKAGCGEPELLRRTRPRTWEIPFDSGRKRMTTVHRLPSGGALVCLKGAPEVVLDAAVLADRTDLVAGVRQQAATLASREHAFRRS